MKTRLPFARNKCWSRLVRASLMAFIVSGFDCNIAKAQSFQEAVQMAIDSSFTLKAEEKRLDVTNERRIQADNMRRPNIQLEAGSGLRSYGTWLKPYGEKGMYWDGTEPIDISITASQPLMLGGRYQTARREADIRYAQGIAKYKLLEQQLVRDVIIAYASVLRDYAIYNIRKDGVENLNKQLEATEARKEVGLIGLTDVAQVKTRLSAANGQMASAEARLISSWAVLQRLVGKRDLELTQDSIVINFPENKEEAITDANRNNLELKVSRFNEDIARANADIARTENSPSVSLNASVVGSLDNGFNGSRNVDTQMNIKVVVPIWSGGRNSSQIRSNLYEAEAARYEARDIEDQLKQQVIIGWENREAANENVKYAEQQVESAKIAREGAELEQRIGARTTLDVLNQEQEVLDARINLASARYEALVAGVSLSILMGKDPTGVSKDENQIEIESRLKSAIDEKYGIPQKWEKPFISLQDILTPIDTELKHQTKYINKALGGEK